MDNDIKNYLEARKSSKSIDEGIDAKPSKKYKTVDDVEFPVKGIDFPSYPIENKGKKPETKTEATLLKKGGKVSSASKRADGIAQRGKTKGRYL